MAGFLQLPTPIPTHDLIAIILHVSLDTISIIENVILLLAVIYRTPASQRSYAVLIYNCVFVDLVAGVCSVGGIARHLCIYPECTLRGLIFRLIPAGDMMGYIYDGPCVNISGFFCHCLYSIMLAAYGQSLYLTTTSFAYRLYVLHRENPPPSKVLLLCLLISIPNLIVLTTFMFTLDDPSEVKNALALARPEYALDGYVLEGQLSIYEPAVMYTILAMTGQNGPLLVVIFVLRMKVLSKIREKSDQMSIRTNKLHRQFTKVLSLQSLLPMCFSVSISCYWLCQSDTMCSPAMEHLVSEAASVVPLLAPAITLYYVQPYRAFVEDAIFGKGKRKISGVDSITDYSPRKVSTI